MNLGAPHGIKILPLQKFYALTVRGARISLLVLNPNLPHSITLHCWPSHQDQSPVSNKRILNQFSFGTDFKAI